LRDYEFIDDRPSILLNISTNLLYERKEIEAQKLWVIVAHQLVELFSRKSSVSCDSSLKTHLLTYTQSSLVRDIQAEPLRVPAFALAEIAFLISLTSADNHVSYLASKALRNMVIAEEQSHAPLNKLLVEEDRAKRNRMYEQLGDPKILIVGGSITYITLVSNYISNYIGRVGHQKRIRKYLRSITYFSPVHAVVWNECYWRWRELSETIFETMREDGRRPLSWQHVRIFAYLSFCD
jgi:hypothetical protein